MQYLLLKVSVTIPVTIAISDNTYCSYQWQCVHTGTVTVSTIFTSYMYFRVTNTWLVGIPLLYVWEIASVREIVSVAEMSDIAEIALKLLSLRELKLLWTRSLRARKLLWTPSHWERGNCFERPVIESAEIALNAQSLRARKLLWNAQSLRARNCPPRLP